MDDEEFVGFVRCAYCHKNKVPFPNGALRKSEHPRTGSLDYYYTCTECQEVNQMSFQNNSLKIQKADP